jgi:hypothetical protein
MRRSTPSHRYTLLFVAFATIVGASATAAYTTGLPDPDPGCSKCIPLARQCEEITVPLTGTPNTSPCVPGGVYVCGYMKIKNSFSASTCGTKVITETRSYGKIVVPGLGEFVTTEYHLNENVVTPESSEITIVDKSRYKNDGCGDSYHMYVTLRMRIGTDGTTSRCESMDIDCVTPCCGN